MAQRGRKTSISNFCSAFVIYMGMQIAVKVVCVSITNRSVKNKEIRIVFSFYDVCFNLPEFLSVCIY